MMLPSRYDDQQLLSTLFINSIDPDVDGKELFKVFKKYGRIMNKITTPQTNSTSDTRKHLKTFIKYNNKEEGKLF